MAKSFFAEQAEQSQVKTAIVTKYFSAWAQVMGGHLKTSVDKRIAYIDLFAGPGRYEDSTKSTPLLILENAIADPKLRDNLVTMFNDKDSENSSSLVSAIKALPGVATLAHQPNVYTEEVGDEIVKHFEQMNLVPTLFFVDPWGYQPVEKRLP